jgi:hypothetical protein
MTKRLLGRAQTASPIARSISLTRNAYPLTICFAVPFSSPTSGP